MTLIFWQIDCKVAILEVEKQKPYGKNRSLTSFDYGVYKL